MSSFKGPNNHCLTYRRSLTQKDVINALYLLQTCKFPLQSAFLGTPKEEEGATALQAIEAVKSGENTDKSAQKAQNSAIQADTDALITALDVALMAVEQHRLSPETLAATCHENKETLLPLIAAFQSPRHISEKETLLLQKILRELIETYQRSDKEALERFQEILDQQQHLDVNMHCFILSFEQFRSAVAKKLNQFTLNNWKGDFLYLSTYDEHTSSYIREMQCTVLKLNFAAVEFIQTHQKSNLEGEWKNLCQNYELLASWLHKIVFLYFVFQYIADDDKSLQLGIQISGFLENVSVEDVNSLQTQVFIMDVLFLVKPELFIQWIFKNIKNLQQLCHSLDQLRYIQLYQIDNDHIQQLSIQEVQFIQTLLQHRNKSFNQLFVKHLRDYLLQYNENQSDNNIVLKYSAMWDQDFIQQCKELRQIDICLNQQELQQFTLAQQVFIKSEKLVDVFQVDNQIKLSVNVLSQEIILYIYSKTIKLNYSSIAQLSKIKQTLPLYMQYQYVQIFDIQFCLQKTKENTSIVLWFGGNPVFFYQCIEQININRVILSNKYDCIISNLIFSQQCLPFYICKAIHYQFTNNTNINLVLNQGGQQLEANTNSIMFNIAPHILIHKALQHQKVVKIGAISQVSLLQNKIISNSTFIQAINEICRQNIHNFQFSIKKYCFQSLDRPIFDTHIVIEKSLENLTCSSNYADTNFVASILLVYNQNIPIDVGLQCLNDISAIYDFTYYDKDVYFQQISQKLKGHIKYESYQKIIEGFDIYNIVLQFIYQNYNTDRCKQQLQNIISLMIDILENHQDKIQLLDMKFITQQLFPLIPLEYRYVFIAYSLQKQNLNSEIVQYITSYSLNTSWHGINVLFSLQNMKIIQQVISFIYTDIINCINGADISQFYQKLSLYNNTCSLLWKFFSIDDNTHGQMINNQQMIEISTMLFIHFYQKQNFLSKLLKYSLSQSQQQLLYAIMTNIVSRCSSVYSKLQDINDSQVFILLYQNYFNEIKQLVDKTYRKIISQHTLTQIKKYFQTVNKHKLDLNCLTIYSLYELLNDQENDSYHENINDIYLKYIQTIITTLNDDLLLSHSQQLIKNFSLNNQNTMIFSLYRQLQQHGGIYNHVVSILEKGILGNINQLLNYQVTIDLAYINVVQIEEYKIVSYQDTFNTLVQSPLYQILQLYGYFQQQNIIKIINSYLANLLQNYLQEYKVEKLAQINYYLHCIFCSQQQAHISIIKLIANEIHQYDMKFIICWLNILITYGCISQYTTEIHKLLKKLKPATQRILILKIYLTEQYKGTQLEKTVEQILSKYKNKGKTVQQIETMLASKTQQSIRVNDPLLIEALLYHIQNREDNVNVQHRLFQDILDFLLSAFNHRTQKQKEQFYIKSQNSNLIQLNRKLLNQCIFNSYWIAGFRDVCVMCGISQYNQSLQNVVYLNQLIKNPFQQILQVFQLQNTLLLILEDEIMFIRNAILQKSDIYMIDSCDIPFLLKQPYIFQQHPLMKDSYKHTEFKQQQWNQLPISVQNNFDIIQDIIYVPLQQITALEVQGDVLRICTFSDEFVLNQCEHSYINQFKSNYNTIMQQANIDRHSIDITPIYSFIGLNYILNIVKLYCYIQNPQKVSEFYKEVEKWFVACKTNTNIHSEYYLDNSIDQEIKSTLREIYRNNDEQMILKRAIINSGIDNELNLLVKAYELPDKLTLTSQKIYALQLIQ